MRITKAEIDKRAREINNDLALTIPWLAERILARRLAKAELQIEKLSKAVDALLIGRRHGPPKFGG